MAVFAKLAYHDGVSLTTLLFLRFAIAGGALAVWGLLRGMRWPRGLDLWCLMALGGVLYVGQAFGYFAALQHASAGLVVMLLFLYPAIVVLLSALVLKRTIGTGQVVAVGVALSGTALVVAVDMTAHLKGVLLGAGAAFIYAVYILSAERLIPRVGPMMAATVVMLTAAVVFGVMALGSGLALPSSATGWGMTLAIAIFSTLVAIFAFFKGLEKLGAADASTISTLEPVIAIILAALVLGETLAAVQLIGGALILAAVVYLVRRPTMG